MDARTDQRLARYEHARWLVGSAEVGWLTTYEGRSPVGSPVDIAEDSTDAARRPMLALRAADGHDQRLAGVPAATLLICEPPVPGLPDDLVSSVALYGRVRVLDGPGADRARELLTRAHPHLDGVLDADASVVPATLDVTGVRHQRRGGDDLLLDLPRYLATPSAPPDRCRRCSTTLRATIPRGYCDWSAARVGPPTRSTRSRSRCARIGSTARSLPAPASTESPPDSTARWPIAPSWESSCCAWFGAAAAPSARNAVSTRDHERLPAL